MDKSSRFFEMSLKAAQRFLQTAVVIDDRAFRQNEVHEPIPQIIEAPPTPSTSAPSADVLFQDELITVEPKENVVPLPDPDPHGIDAEKVIRSFAELGIVCSVLQRFPGENPADVGTSGEKLFVPSDILVIDWQVHDKNGFDSNEETLKFLEKSIAKIAGDTPHQLRVTIVYTGAQDLLKVAEKIEQRLKDRVKLPLQKDGKFAFQIGASRIVVLGKYSRIRSPESSKQQVGSDEDLAAWATREFTAMTAGLVSNVALDALAAIREVTHRFLTRFASALDAPFLAHRSLLSPPSDGNSHLLPLIVSEIEGILEERLGDDFLSDQMITDWLNTRPDPKPLLAGISTIETTEQARQVVRDVCLRGAHGYGEFSIPNQPGWVKKLAEGKGVSDLQKLTDLIGAENAQNANERLEELMSLRPRYGKKPPALTLGTLLKSQPESSDPLYWLCLQPACDCFIRTGGDRRAFPFLSVTKSEQQFNLLACHQGSYIRLKWEPRLHNIQMFEFQANTAARAVISREIEGVFRFRTVDNTEFQWIGELKFPQAQRIANSLAAASARVGLTESEWLRRNGR